ncbi:hypothetical protein, partial [Pseudomonas aeruginosa]|uniref:hypothetical protein n=1 Tax=Pseudomonas aeruginosa TaxID=287 RepID=UPI0020CFC356
PKKSRGTSRIVTDAITIQNPRNRGGSTGHVLAKRSVTFTEIRRLPTFAFVPGDARGQTPLCAPIEDLVESDLLGRSAAGRMEVSRRD